MKTASALKWRNLEIDIITNFEGELSATTISISFLARLSNAKILTNNSDLGWKQKSWLYKVNFKELGKTKKKGHQGKFFSKTFLLDIVY